MSLERLEERRVLAGGTLALDFNSPVDDQGNSNGDLIFNGPNGFQVTFTDDDSNGPSGGDAAGVHITNENFGNVKVGDQNDFVIGAFNTTTGGNSFHTSGIVASFNRGVKSVSFDDTDDDQTPKTLYAFDQAGNLIAQTAAASRVNFALDLSDTGGTLIHSIEFDTDPGTAGGSNNTTSFTIDNFEVEIADRVLLVDVFSSTYDIASVKMVDRLEQLGVAVDEVELTGTGGQAALALSTNQYEQIWVYDLSFAPDNFSSDWNAIGGWFNNRVAAGDEVEIIADGRILSSYYSIAPLSESDAITTNYYRNLDNVDGGLMLGTDHDGYTVGTNSINAIIGLGPFTGNFAGTTIPVDQQHPLMSFPTQLTSVHDHTSTSQPPTGFQAGLGRTMYPVAWHSGDANFPAITSTIEGVAGFRVDIVSPVTGTSFLEGQTISFDADSLNSTGAVTFDWSSSLDGVIGNLEAFQSSDLSPGEHTISVLADDTGSPNSDSDSITVSVAAAVDFAPLNLSAVPTGVSGTNLALTYDLQNLGSAGASTAWTDFIYLSEDSVLDPGSDLLLGSVEQLPALAPGATGSYSASVDLPYLSVGDYNLFVVANQLGLPEGRTDNNTSAPLPISIVNQFDVYDWDVSQLVPVGRVQAIATAQTGAQHYNYFSASAHPTGVNVGPTTSNIWVHENSNTGEFSFGFVFGEDDDAPTNAADFAFRIVDSDTDVFVAQSDDPGEATETAPGAFVGTFNYGVNTDGISVGGITGEDWTIIIDSVDFGVVNQWFASNGTGPDFADDLPLTIGNEYRLVPAGKTPSGASANPARAINPMPADGAVDVAIDQDLSWEVEQSLGVTFDVRFGTTANPPIVATGLSDLTFDLPVMDLNTEYFWQVDSQVAGRTVSSDVWSFTTIALPDLQPSNPSGPSIVQFGETTTVTFDVANVGDRAADGLWIDSVYVSTDDQFDAGDTLIGSAAFLSDGVFPIGASYAQSVTVTLPQSGPTGDLFFIVVPDAGDGLDEIVEGDFAATPVKVFDQGPQIISQVPTGFTSDDITRIVLETSESLSGVGANDAASYVLTDLGPDRQIGGGDDIVIPVAPNYIPGTTQIDLLPDQGDSIDLSAWVERDYEGNGSAGDWRIENNGASVKQYINGDPTYFVSDFDFIDREFVGRIGVETTGDDDFIGIAFGLDIDPATSKPNSYYLLHWKQGNQSVSGWGFGEAGFKLLKLTNTSSLSEATMSNWLWDGENNSSGAATVEVISRNTASNLGWADNTQYDFAIRYESNGNILVSIRNSSTGIELFSASVNDASSLGSGKVGFFNFSQSDVRYSGLRQTDFLAEGAYQLRVISGATGIESTAGVPLDGDAGVAGFEDYVGQFVIDQTAPVVSQVSPAPGAVDIEFFDAGGVDPADAIDPSKFSLISSGGDGTFDDGNEIPLLFSGLDFDDLTDTTTLSFSPSLGDERYQLVIDGITDLAGNVLAGPIVETFEILTGPASVSLDLQDASDSGVSDTDDLTNDNTPTFDVTVDKAGLIGIDYTGDLVADVTQLVAAAGTVSFTTAVLADGEHSITATFQPAVGSAVNQSLDVEIDTAGPRVVPGAATEQAPLSGRQVVFNEPIDSDSILPTDVVMFDPLGNPVPLISGSGSGDTFTLTFDPIIEPGIYSIAASVNLTDLAGNQADQNGDGINGQPGDEPIDSFELLADTTAPFVESFSPTGTVAEDVDGFSVVLSETIDPSTFTIDEVSIVGPSGPLDLSQSEIVPISNSTGVIYWTDWLTGGNDAAGFTSQGTISTDTGLVSVTYNNPQGIAFFQPSGGIDYWQNSGGGRNPATSPYTSEFVTNIPTGTDIVALNRAGNQSLTFSQPIANPVFSFVSLNGNGYAFDRDFEILSFASATDGNDAGYWGGGLSYKEVVDLGGGNFEYRLLGTGEPHGTLRFLGTFDAVSWRSLSDEFWNGFTVGIDATAESIREYRITTPGLVSEEGLYQITLDSSIADLSGNTLTGDYQASLVLDKTGPSVDAVSPSGTVNEAVSSVDVTFDTAIDPSSVSTDDFALTGPAGAVAISSVDLVAGNTYRVVFPAQVDGDFSLTIGPDVTDLIGNDMTQNAGGAFTTGFSVELPDLSPVDPLDLGVATAVLGEDLTISWQLANLGDATAFGPFSQRLVLSTDETFSVDDILLADVAVTQEVTIPAGQSASYQANVMLPLESSVPAGQYFVLLLADSDAQVTESNESNNLASATIELTVPPLPDLVATNLVAPQNHVPGLPLTYGWSTDNVGAADAVGPWVERVYLVDLATGNRQLLGSVTVDATLGPADAPIVHQATFVVPATGLGGDLSMLVEIDGFDNVVETDEDNEFVAAATTFVPLVLNIQSDLATVSEGGEAATLTITRNGDVGGALLVTLSDTPAGQLDLPDQVTILAGQNSVRLDVPATVDGLADGDFDVTVTAAATDYASDDTTLNVIDTDLPVLSLDLTTSTVQEGGSLIATVSRDFVTNVSIDVTISLSDNTQLSSQGSVTIPAGQASADFLVTAVDDTLVELDAGYSIDVSAPGLISGNASVTVPQNDVPTLTLILPADSLAEGASGPTIVARVSRPVATNRPLRVAIAADQLGILSLPSQVTIPAGETFVEFPFGVNEDDDVNPGRSVTVTSSVVTDDVQVTIADGAGSDSLTILDNDGPTLSIVIDRSLISESGTTTATVSRNTDTTNALLVSLFSEDETEASVSPASIEIPSGQSSVQFTIHGVNDQSTDGNQTVSVRADAAGFESGVGTLVVTDIDLADLVVTSVSGPASGLTDSEVDVSWTILNDGLATAAGTWVQRLYLSSDATIGNDILLGQYSFSGQLAVGQSYDRVAPIRLPNTPGDYYFVLETDVTRAVEEGLESNNTRIGSTMTTVQAAYSATVSTDIDSAPADTPVLMTGVATRTDGSPAAFSQVKVDLRVRGTKRSFPAITDASGNFQVTFNPLPGEGGLYTIGASHPGVVDAPIQDQFQLIGMRAEPRSRSLTLVEAAPAIDSSVVLRNLADVPVTGLAIQIDGNVPANIQASASLAGGATEMASTGTLDVLFSLAATDASVTSGTINLRITSNEAPDVVVPIRFNVTPLFARLSSSPGSLAKSMLVGDQTSFDFTITNTGGIETGELQVLLPAGAPWLTVASGETLPSLQPGQSRSISLLLTPGSDLPLTAYNGSLVVRGDETQITVPFSFRAVSDQTGDLVVTIVDEFFYFTDESPLVQGATVIVRDAISGNEIIRTNPVSPEVNPQGDDAPTVMVDADGRITFAGLPEGPYTLEVLSPDHDVANTTVQIESGELNREQIFVSRNLVEYTWKVEEIEVEDRTRVTIDAQFETNVPAPVVTIEGVIDLADLQVVGQTQQYNIKVTNHGLIAAEDVAIQFGDHPFYEITPLIDTIGVLPAKSELVIPVTVRRVADFDPNAAGLQSYAGGNVPCSIVAIVIWVYDCGPNNVRRSAPIAVINVEGFCPTGAPYSPGGGGGGGGGGRGGPGGVTPVIIESPDVDCQDCTVEKWELSVKENGLVNKVINAAADLLEVSPPVESLEFSVSGKASWETCCDGDEEDGSKLAAEGEGAVAAQFNVPLVGASIDIIEDLPINIPAGAQVDVDLRAGIFLSGEVAGSIYGKAESECDDWTDWSGCAGVKVGGKLEVSAQVGINVDIEYLGREYDIIISVAGGIRGSAEAFAQFCFDNGETEFDWEATIGKVELFGAATFVIGQETAELFAVDDGTEFRFEISETIYEGCTWSKDNPGGTCGAGGSSLGVDLASQLTVMAGEPGTMPINPVTGEVIDTSIGNVIDIEKLPEDTGFASTQAMLDDLGVTQETLENLEPQQWQDTFDDIREIQQPDVFGSGVCAVVSIQINQEAVQTRQGFQATLELNNGLPQSLVGIGVDVYVINSLGEDVTDDFGIFDPVLTNFTSVDGVGALSADTVGTAVWTIIPTTDAAKEGPTEYFVGGTLRYTEAGTQVTIPLAPASITVVPQPELFLDYFLQRDVISDDPFTDPIEPAEPFILGVQVRNEGFGEATNLSIESAQPKIIENEKGLLIDFEIIGTSVNGAEVDRSLTAQFGNLAPGGLAFAEWQMESTLQGLFVEYEATFEHLSGLGDERLSLIKAVEIHELIRSVDASQVLPDSLPDFLVNDLPDPLDSPDTLYLSDGTTAEVTLGTDAAWDAAPVVEDLLVAVTATMQPGWSYLKMDDPSSGDFELIGILRSDGTELPLKNFWQTDRTFVGGGQRPVLEDKIHLLDVDSTGSYTFIFSNGDLDGPTVQQIGGVDPNPTTTAVDTLSVAFNEVLRDGTFELDDVDLFKNGELIAFGAGVSLVNIDGANFEIQGLAGDTADDAIYELVVDASGVTDQVGNPGVGEGQFTWVKGEAAPTILQLSGAPSGTTTSVVDFVEVTFSEPIQISTFTSADFSLSRDGVDIPTAGLSVTPVQDTTYRIGGLAGLTNVDGDYELEVRAGDVLDLGGATGLGSQTATWTLDATAPIVIDVIDVATNPRNIVVQRIDIEFSEPIDVTTFDVNDLVLTRDGAPENLIAGDARVEIVERGNNVYRVQGINWVQSVEGTYTLTVLPGGITDLAGNAATGDQSESWVLDLTDPGAAANLILSTASGPVVGGQVNALQATLSGDLSEPGLTVTIRDVETGEDLASETFDGNSFSLPFEFNSVGNHDLRVRTTDPAGNTTDVLIEDLFVELSQPLLAGVFGLPDTVTKDPVNFFDVTFVAEIQPGTFTPADLELTRDGGANLIDAGVAVQPLADGLTYRITGVDSLTDNDGRYELSLDLAGILNPAGVAGTDLFTSAWLKDSVAPSSFVRPLPVSGTLTSFAVSVSGQDPVINANVDGSGVEAYLIYQSTNGGAFELWQSVPAQSPTAIFNGTPGNTYAFYSIARDVAGNLEAAPPVADAETTIEEIILLGSIGDFVWSDDNFNGVQDPGETGVEGISVNLFVDDGVSIAPLLSTTTGPSGDYEFTGLDTSLAYYLQFNSIAGFGFTAPNTVANDAIDSDPDLTGRTETFSILPGNNSIWDAGLVALSSINGTVFNDANENQILDGESGIANWVVYLDSNDNGQLDAGEPSQVTDADGTYTFSDLRPGEYIVAQEVQNGWEQTFPGVGGASGAQGELPYHSSESNVQVFTPGIESEPSSSQDAASLINLDDFRADPRFSGVDGSGYSVVVIDTGIDNDHGFFGADADGDGVADRIVYQYDFADRDADASDVSGHGSHVSSVIASQDVSYPGVAPGVGIIHLKVFGDNGVGFFGDVEDALQWVIENADAYNIAAVNMSLGDGFNWSQPRGLHGIDDELAVLSANNVITVAASGNAYGLTGAEGLAYPAADPNAISVGAVWDTDRGGPWSFGDNGIDYTTGAGRITSFSQRHSGMLDVVAPGALISGANAFGGVTAMRGTSMATPFVTGAAVLAQQLAVTQLGRQLTTSEFRYLLESSGAIVIDGDDEHDNVPNTGAAFSRLDMTALADAVLAYDGTLPVGGGTTSGGGGEQVIAPSNGRPYRYTIDLAPGQDREDVDFGNRLLDSVGPVVQDIVDVTPDPRTSSVETIDVVFDEVIDLSSFTHEDVALTRDGVAVPLDASVTTSLVSGTTYRITGLGSFTTDDGSYTLTVDGTSITDIAGNAGTTSASDQWVTDTVAPTSSVQPLSPAQTSKTFPITVAGSDSGSGIVSYEIYRLVNGTAWELWTTVSSDTTTVDYTGNSGDSVGFYSVAIDKVGNRETKSPTIESGTYIPDFDAPVTQVDSVDTSYPAFNISFSGTDEGRLGLEAFEVYVSIDGSAVQSLGVVPAGAPDASGVYTGSMIFQAITDGTSHTYRFFTIGTDRAPTPNVELAPASPEDVTVQAEFDVPSDLEVINFDVQRGALQRSYIRYLDVTFNTQDFGDLIASLDSPDIVQDRLRLLRFSNDGATLIESVSLVDRVDAVDQLMQIDFGPEGIGGDANSATGDGYYRLEMDLDGDGSFETSKAFYRLFGDATGNRSVGYEDLSPIFANYFAAGQLDSDLNGDEFTDYFDYAAVVNNLNHVIDGSLDIDD